MDVTTEVSSASAQHRDCSVSKRQARDRDPLKQSSDRRPNQGNQGRVKSTERVVPEEEEEEYDDNSDIQVDDDSGSGSGSDPECESARLSASKSTASATISEHDAMINESCDDETNHDEPEHMGGALQEESDCSIVGNWDLQGRHDQLEEDVNVLVAHLEKQNRDVEREREAMQTERLHFQDARHAMNRELQGVQIENAALRRQNALLSQERDEQKQSAALAVETHDELLAAVRGHQQRDDHARSVVTGLIKERDALKKQLDASQTYCRSLEEDVVMLRAEVQHLRSENAVLSATAQTAVSTRDEREARVMHEQQEMLQSLRADLLQMEFEFKTLTVDKEQLSAKLAALQRQASHHSYDVISLSTGTDTGARASSSSTKSKWRRGKQNPPHKLTVTTTSHVQGNGGGGRRDADRDGFANLMALPNTVHDDDGENDVSLSSISATSSSRGPRTSPVGALVSKTISSAKKKLFHAPHQTAVTPR